MKNLFYLIIAFFSLTFSLNSCEDDGDWDDITGGQFGFTIERDTYFIEKSVGESNQIKFNIVPNYDYSTVPMKFKYTSSLNGTLSLNGQNLQQNVEYTLTNKENIFSYVGNVQGSHDIVMIARNDKGISKEEKFTLEYGISEFTHTFSGGTANIYQSDETPYLMKIVPNAGQPNTGFEIKFNSYNGNIKLNGVAVQTGQFYPLPNIDNFTVILATNQVGQGALDYTIKNATVQKSYNIQQTVIARQIVIESMNINALNVLPNSQMSLIGVVKKTPVTTNTTIKYKTWISASSNNNTNGIQNTNNAYVPYALGANGAFSINFNAVQAGNYTYNIQAQDEYGNESAVSTFNVVVAPEITFVGAMAMNVDFRYVLQFSGVRTYLKDFKRSFKAVAGGSATIIKIEYNITFDHMGQARNYNFTENVTNGTNIYEVTDANFGTGTSEMAYVTNVPNPPITNLQAKIKATSSTGAVLEQTLTPTYNFTMGL
ncbi:MULTISPECIES: hypothetical protein [Chryseobacterium]|uniref:DUF4958 domain-containing protein n=1 Tax=Chryseobacterium muglaense TaxID=2893752 RepID=A0ABR8M8X5_9FLAO|nr:MULTISPECIES: hypothetical protein [Chryseobacterium]MBD3906759.1 hypothetical protein [Chryseobacterium muglaense]